MRKIRTIVVWVVVSLCVLTLLTLPVNLQTQLVISVTVIIIM